LNISPKRKNAQFAEQSEVNRNTATAISTSQRPSFSIGKHFNNLGRFDESEELGLPHFAGSLMEVESRSKSPI
jgi:hypothetical protein